MTKILGIDPGETTGYGLIKIVDGKPIAVDYGVIPVTGLSEAKIFTSIYTWLSEYLMKNDAEVVAIEGPVRAPRFTDTLTNEVRGIVKLVVAKANIGWNVIPPATIKKHVTGSGRAKKREVQDAVRRILGIPVKTVDVTDAFAVALALLEEEGDGENGR